MSDGDLLLRSILERPEDDTARLVYADWLEENGDSEWAEYIRLTVKPDKSTANQRRKATIRMSKRWSAVCGLPHEKMAYHFNWKRGFIESVVIHSFQLSRVVPVAKNHPVEWISVLDRDQWVSDHGILCGYRQWIWSAENRELPKGLPTTYSMKTNDWREALKLTSDAAIKWCREQQ